MKKILILKGNSIEEKDNYFLKECLKIMFPDCEIEIRTNSDYYSDEKFQYLLKKYYESYCGKYLFNQKRNA